MWPQAQLKQILMICFKLSVNCLVNFIVVIYQYKQLRWLNEGLLCALQCCIPAESDGHLSDIMPDVAMATASLSQLQLQEVELELDLGDGNSHPHLMPPFRRTYAPPPYHRPHPPPPHRFI